MTYSDLDTGHLVETTTGEVFVVQRGLRYKGSKKDIVLYKHAGFDSLDSVRRFTFNAVYETNSLAGISKDIYDKGNYKLIWERKPNIEIDVRINGQEVALSEVSEETLLNLRNQNQ